MLGLLLVVTMLANYLSTQLPGQMQANDAAHAITVEDQIARLATALQGAAGVGAIGAVLTQPVSLGSQGEPPFAPGDGASIAPGPQGSQVSEAFTVTGASSYSPPQVGHPGGTTTGASCSSATTTQLTCSDPSSAKVVWNFTGGSASYSITTGGGPYYVNTSTSNSTFSLTSSSSLTMYVLIVGSNDSISLTLSASATAVHIIMVGNYDSVTFAAGSITSSTVSVYMVGNHDSISSSALTLSSGKLFATYFGSNDSVALGTTTETGSGSVNVYFNGFVPVRPSSSCPVDNLASSTDTVSAGTSSGSNFNVTYNDTTVSSGSVSSPWKGTFGTPSISCPFYSILTLPERSSGTVGASFVIALKNTYTPPVEIAYDEGAVVLAQREGVPLMIVKPGITYVGGNLSLWVPEFLGSVGTEVGTGTAELSVRLVSLLNVSLPSGGLNLSGTTSVAITTPFAAAWYSYLNATSSLSGDVKCVPKTSAACAGPFAMNGPLGTVYVNVTATVLSLQLATYAIALS